MNAPTRYRFSLFNSGCCIERIRISSMWFISQTYSASLHGAAWIGSISPLRDRK